TALLYERQGALVRPQVRLGGDMHQVVSEAEATNLLRDSDFVILKPSGAVPEQTLYPFNECMANLRPRLVEFCERSFVSLWRFHSQGRELLLYVGPRLEMSGDAGDWVPSDGLVLTAAANVLRRFPVVELRGSAFDGVPALPGKPLEAWAEIIAPAT